MAALSRNRGNLLGYSATDILLGPLREFPLVTLLAFALMMLGFAWPRNQALLVVGCIGALLRGATGCAMAGLRVT